MSRSETALLTHAMPNASQVLTTDSEITITEANDFILFDGAGLSTAASGLVSTSWWHLHVGGWYLVDGSMFRCLYVLIGTPRCLAAIRCLCA